MRGDIISVSGGDFPRNHQPDAKNDAASAALVGFNLNFHTLAKTTLTGLYGR